MDGQTDRRMEGQMDRHTDGQADILVTNATLSYTVRPKIVSFASSVSKEICIVVMLNDCVAGKCIHNKQVKYY